MATAKQTKQSPEKSQGLKNAVAKETKQAETNAREGNVATVPESAAQPADALTNARSHPNT